MAFSEDVFGNSREVEKFSFEHPGFGHAISVEVDFTDRDDYKPIGSGHLVEETPFLDEIRERVNEYHSKYPNRDIGEVKIVLDNDGGTVDFYEPAVSTVEYGLDKGEHEPKHADDKDWVYEVYPVTDEAIMKHGRELAHYPNFTINKLGEAVGLSDDEAKYLQKRTKDDVFKEAKDTLRECGVNGVARPECLRQEVR